jgi:hypothetical protein
MSETREVVEIPKATLKKLKSISKKFSKLNTGAVGDDFWIGSGNESGDYEWGQFDIGVNKKGELITCTQGGCSCNGPEEPTPDTTQSLDKPFTIENGYYGDEKAAIEDLIGTTDTLYKVLNGKSVEPKEVIGLPNAEIRRAAVELIGYDKIVSEAQVLDESETDGTLLKVPLREDEDIVLVHVKDPSTTREYFLRVPPNTKTAKQARAWTFGFGPEDFAPVQES